MRVSLAAMRALAGDEGEAVRAWRRPSPHDRRNRTPRSHAGSLWQRGLTFRITEGLSHFSSIVLASSQRADDERRLAGETTSLAAQEHLWAFHHVQLRLSGNVSSQR